MALSEVQICLLGIATIWSIAWMCVQLQSLRLLWRFKELYWLKARWSTNDVIVIAVIATLYVGSRPFCIWEAYHNKGHQTSHLNTGDAFARVMSVLLSVGPLAGIALLVLVRVWFQYFTAKLAVQSGLAEWRSMIDDSLDVNHMSWFIRYRRSWGKRKFLHRFAITLWLLFMTVAIVLCSVGKTSDDPVYVALSVLIVSMLSWVAIDYPAGKDTIHLRKENWIFGIFTAVIAFLWMTVLLIPVIADWNWHKHEDELTYLTFFRQIIVTLYFPGACFIISNMVISFFILPSIKLELESCLCMIPLDFQPINSGYDRLNTDYSGLNSGTASSSTAIKMRLSDVLADTETFREFMTHLHNEYSLENALCLIQCCKFRDRVREVSENPGRSSDAQFGIRFCDAIEKTQSTLVSRIRSARDARAVAVALVNRYIRVDANDQVNMSFKIRNETMELLENRSAPVDYTVFDDVIAECLYLLRDSLTRFDKAYL